MLKSKKSSAENQNQNNNKINYSAIERFAPDTDTGLTSKQVELRKNQGLVNGETDIKTKSVGRIIFDNCFTAFNILNLALAVLVLSVGSFKNVLFMNIIILNTFIGSFQEIRAKKTIDRLALVSSPKANVIRNGKQEAIPISEIVLDDIFCLKSGNQICCDCKIISGSCEVNEALITGESDPLQKEEGDAMLSGSFVSSGSCLARVEHIGADNYATKISDRAKYVKKPNSDILKWVNIIIKAIGIMIVPIGALLFYKELYLMETPFKDAVVSIVAALIGMIPEGLILLISVVFAVGVVRLSKHKTLVQELYCIETLARVDTLCLDKTGTITQGTMQVDGVTAFENHGEAEIKAAVAACVTAQKDTNPTFDALRQAFPENPSWSEKQIIPFSSARKWSGVFFENKGSYIIGAPEFVLKENYEAYKDKIESYANKGYRVLVLVHSEKGFTENELPSPLEAFGLIILSDVIRPSAKLTLEYFADQGVDIKVISGDNPVTVSNVAKKAGLENADRYVDASTLETPLQILEASKKYTVFGRVTPEQKLLLVKALKKEGHTVAMTGDGVNDVLALKEADCSIAMASGSDAARTVSQLVLLNSDFSSLPFVVKEGRRSINNLQRSASLYLVKAIFSAILAIFFVFCSSSYPFQPIQLTLISFATIGTPSLILALEPNFGRVKGKFIINVLTKALPPSLSISLNIILLTFISSFLNLTHVQFSTLCVIMTGFTGFIMLMKVCTPLNTIRTVLFISMASVFCLAVIFFGEFFSITQIDAVMMIILIPMMFFSVYLMSVTLQTLNKIIEKHSKNK